MLKWAQHNQLGSFKKVEEEGQCGWDLPQQLTQIPEDNQSKRHPPAQGTGTEGPDPAKARTSAGSARNPTCEAWSLCSHFAIMRRVARRQQERENHGEQLRPELEQQLQRKAEGAREEEGDSGGRMGKTELRAAGGVGTACGETRHQHLSDIPRQQGAPMKT